jgi:hypothetical protein
MVEELPAVSAAASATDSAATATAEAAYASLYTYTTLTVDITDGKWVALHGSVLPTALDAPGIDVSDVRPAEILGTSGVPSRLCRGIDDGSDA